MRKGVSMLHCVAVPIPPSAHHTMGQRTEVSNSSPQTSSIPGDHRFGGAYAAKRAENQALPCLRAIMPPFAP
jgi:hypothetical protein